MRILIVEDDAALRRGLEALLKLQYEVVSCGNGKEALDLLKKSAFQVVITDNQLPGMDGMELLRHGKKLSPATAFLMMTGFGSTEQSLEALRLGADDYFFKPFDINEVQHRIRRIGELQALGVERVLRAEERRGVSRMIGSSEAIKKAKAFVTQVSVADAPVLILGPTGAGKEVIANAIHESGARKVGPFIPINCGSLNEHLMESELFGHEKGSFSGAENMKPGKFELASEGTLFLDEVGEMSPALQAKLLRVLQEKEFYRVGGVQVIRTQARVIAATHRPLEEMVKDGSFREDLFFRFNVLTYEMCGLKGRLEDVPMLMDHFLAELSPKFGRKLKLANKTRELMGKYEYPGNIRELRNILERLAVLSVGESEIGPDYLPPEFHGKGFSASGKDFSFLQNFPSGLSEATELLEIRMIKEAMEKAQQNQVQAAKLLKIDRSVLRYKLKKYEDLLEESKKEAA